MPPQKPRIRGPLSGLDRISSKLGGLLPSAGQGDREETDAQENLEEVGQEGAPKSNILPQPQQETTQPTNEPDPLQKRQSRFSGTELSNPPQSFLEQIAPSLIGIGGTAIAGLIGGKGAAADFGGSFMATTKQLSDEKKAEQEQNLTRFERALEAGRLDEAFSLVNTLSPDMMEGAVAQLEATDVERLQGVEKDFSTLLLGATTTSQLDAVLKQIKASKEADDRAKEALSAQHASLSAPMKTLEAEAAERARLVALTGPVNLATLEAQRDAAIFTAANQRELYEKRIKILDNTINTGLIETKAKEQEDIARATKNYKETGDDRDLIRLNLDPNKILQINKAEFIENARLGGFTAKETDEIHREVFTAHNSRQLTDKSDSLVESFTGNVDTLFSSGDIVTSVQMNKLQADAMSDVERWARSNEIDEELRERTKNKIKDMIVIKTQEGKKRGKFKQIREAPPPAALPMVAYRPILPQTI
jgi:hypothetical protein